MQTHPPTDFATEQLQTAIADITQEFTNDTSNNTVIMESFFVGVFLPMFANDEKLPHPVTLHMWLDLAHGPFREVTVVNDKREILFNVPATSSQDAIRPLDGTGRSARMPTVTDMITTARHYSNRGPNVVQNFIANEMSQRAFMFNHKDMNADHIRRWNEIFARYNRPLLPVTAVATNTLNNNAHDIARDSSEFDELG